WCPWRSRKGWPEPGRALPTTAGSAAPTRFHGMLADRRVINCNVASAVSMDCVVTNTSRDACARGAGQVAAKTGDKAGDKTGETKTGETRSAVAANIRPMGLGIVRAPPSRQACKGKASI